MRKYLYILFLSGYILMPVQASPDVNKAIIEIISNATQYEDFKTLMPFIRDIPYIFRYIPVLSPLKVDDKVRLTSHYGYRKDPFTGERKFHTGIDYTTEYATFIYATADGTVTFSGNKAGYGQCIIIEHDFGFETVYAHLSGIKCNKEAFVKKGSIIGFLGHTGRATGQHIHYEIKKNGIYQNPINYIENE